MIGIIGAMANEVEILIDSLGKYEEIKIGSFTFYLGKIEEHEIVLTQSGVGKVNAAIATTILITEFECDFIINTGIAGGVNDVDTKDVIVCEGLIYSDFDLTPFGYEFGTVPHLPPILRPHPSDVLNVKSILNRLGIKYKTGLIASGDKFVTSPEDIKEVKDRIIACEMESTSVAQTAIRLGTRFMILRFISDIVGKESQIENYNEFEEEMSKLSSKITLELIRNL